MTRISPWWAPHRHADRRPFLLARNRIKAAIRHYFDQREFTEVECAALQLSPGNETHLHAFRTNFQLASGNNQSLYLHTSPEFAAKKLLAAGETRIFDFARVFRNREHARFNVCEFTMLEWYRAQETYDQVIDDCLALLRIATTQAGSTHLRRGDKMCDPQRSPIRMTVCDAFQEFSGINLRRTLTEIAADRDDLAYQARSNFVDVSADDTWSDIFSRVLVEKVEPNLGFGSPAILDCYPRIEAALARPSKVDPIVSERFELYVCGIELANGFGELTDPQEQRRRFDLEMDEKERRYGERYPIDEDFIAALDLMPDASGVALGFDRLVMLATGAPNIESIMWTPPAGRDT